MELPLGREHDVKKRVWFGIALLPGKAVPSGPMPQELFSDNTEAHVWASPDYPILIFIGERHQSAAREMPYELICINCDSPVKMTTQILRERYKV